MKKILFILYTCCILLFPVSAQQIPSFKANDRIVFLGNSITEGGGESILYEEGDYFY